MRAALCAGEVVGELAPAGSNGTAHLANGFALEAAAVTTDPLWPELEKQVGFSHVLLPRPGCTKVPDYGPPLARTGKAGRLT